MGEFQKNNNNSKVITAMSHGGRFLLKLFEIWAGFGLVDNIEKNWVDDYEQLLSVVFSCLFQGQKKIIN